MSIIDRGSSGHCGPSGFLGDVLSCSTVASTLIEIFLRRFFAPRLASMEPINI